MREVCKTAPQLHIVLFNWIYMLYGVEVMYNCNSLLI